MCSPPLWGCPPSSPLRPPRLPWSSWQARPIWSGSASPCGGENGNGHAEKQARAARESLRRTFTQGFLTNALNPKVALFFLAFLPQFVAADAPCKPLAFLFLGLVFTINGTFVNLTYAWTAARTAALFNGGGKYRTWIKRTVGTLFLGLGVRLALADRI